MRARRFTISGNATTPEKPADDVFGVSAPAIRLKRLVEIYQWKEKKEESKQTKLGGGEETVTTYTYTKAWEDHIEDSSDFKHPEGHQNPERKPYETVEFDSSDVSVGAFKLSSKLIDQMKDFEPLSIDEQSAPLPAGVSKKMKLAGGGIYMGSNPDSPEVGDSRIRFQVVKPGPVSVIGLQTGNSFQSFVSPHGETLMLTDGIKSANEMFAAEASRNATITWILRLCGFIFMWIGFTMLVRPLRGRRGCVALRRRVGRIRQRRDHAAGGRHDLAGDDRHRLAGLSPRPWDYAVGDGRRPGLPDRSSQEPR